MNEHQIAAELGGYQYAEVILPGPKQGHILHNVVQGGEVMRLGLPCGKVTGTGMGTGARGASMHLDRSCRRA